MLAPAGPAPAAPALAAHAGDEGLARSPLRPAGTVEVDGRLLDAVSDGDWIAPGTRVRVLAVEASHLVVAPAAAPSPPRPPPA
jgi:membrane-bound ClpP family serine protease